MSADDERPGEHRDSGLDLARLISRRISASLQRAASRPGAAARRGSASAAVRRPRPPSGSGAHPDDRDPQPLGSSVRRLVDDQGWDVDLRLQAVFARWGEIVGPGVAEHCRPVSCAGGRLVVRADSTAWATQLRLLSPDLVRRLCQEVGEGTVAFVDVEGPTGPSWTKGRLRVRGRGPRDTYG